MVVIVVVFFNIYKSSIRFDDIFLNHKCRDGLNCNCSGRFKEIPTLPHISKGHNRHSHHSLRRYHSPKNGSNVIPNHSVDTTDHDGDKNGDMDGDTYRDRDRIIVSDRPFTSLKEVYQESIPWAVKKNPNR